MSSNQSAVKIPAQVSILLPLPLKEAFDYTCDSTVSIGVLVKVPFGARKSYGIVWKGKGTYPSKKCKTVFEVFENVCLPEVSLKFIEWVSEYTMAFPGQILKMVLPLPEAFDMKRKSTLKPLKFTPIDTPQKPQLSMDQWAAAEDIKRSLEGGEFQTFLLEGVTGSGKTEVYFDAIENVLANKGQALVLLPEIALTAQWLQRFEARFGFRPALWHSETKKSEKKQTLRALMEGQVPVMVGARSSLFLPFSDLKLIIVDEEHDGSYKQEEGVIYNARDMAIVRARLSDATCVLASATPSLETELNARIGKYRGLYLMDRYGGAHMPEVRLIDLRKEKIVKQTWLSEPLREAMKTTMNRGEQAMLFLNRRGYAPLVVCQVCGERIMCPHCSLPFVYHKFHEQLLCHHCGAKGRLPDSCPKCQEKDTYSSYGPGVERIYEEVRSFLPEARCALLSSDHMTNSKTVFEQIKAIQEHEVDILIGTQIMAKGHHFPLLTLVGIVDGDATLSGSDLRASEKAFQLLHQVSGRSGREKHKGQVLLQTHMPEHPVMKALVDQDRGEFFALESDQRLIHGLPPYGRLAALIVSGMRKDDVEKFARHLARTFPLTQKADLLGPAPAPIPLLRGQYRWRLLLRTSKEVAPQPLLKKWLSQTPVPHFLKLQIDIDPYSFY
ncbi:MAG: primosomal protein N' [Alphaproteobacteria bacterium]|nr:primosomal protein N' [Alphaproteobacteria bacterium]